jgi:peroxiredoxin
VVVSQPARSPELSDEDLSADVSAPQVLLSADHQATCRVQVGDTFPDLSLMTREGQPTLLNAHLGQRLTIVIFWNHRQPMSVEQIERLQQDFAERYRNAGVAVVTVNVGESPEQLGQAAEPAPAGMVSLCDPRGEAFGQVATGLLPRTYLLRADRQVVWFDLEYSRSTRRELRNAILYVLRQFDQQAHAGGASLM